jgi:hypothetical protein
MAENQIPMLTTGQITHGTSAATRWLSPPAR